MTRQEQIKEAAMDAAYQSPPRYSEMVMRATKIMSAYEIGYIEGAQWADEHPHWISVEDELPKREGDYSDFSIRVLATDGEDVFKAMLQNDGTWFTHDLWVFENVTHWMPLPAPPISKMETTTNEEGGSPCK